MSDEERREAWALFRYNVIAPLLESGLDGAEKATKRKVPAAKVVAPSPTLEDLAPSGEPEFVSNDSLVKP